MRYRMLAIDLDGTLLGREGRISRANVEAVQRAIHASVQVVPCTGRGWCECRDILVDLLGAASGAEGVFVTGAAVNDLATGRTLDISVIEPHLVLEIVEYLWDRPEAVLVFRDAAAAGSDYLVTGAGQLTPNTRWWFQATATSVQRLERVSVDDLHHTLRVGLVADCEYIAELTQGLVAAFRPRVAIQHFEAVQKLNSDWKVHVVEAFAAGVDKWRGLMWIAQQRGIEPHQIAAIGDQVNDVAMLRQAGCGIAMGNAVDVVTSVADHVTRRCDQDGVAYAIDQLLSGQWG